MYVMDLYKITRGLKTGGARVPLPPPNGLASAGLGLSTFSFLIHLSKLAAKFKMMMRLDFAALRALLVLNFARQSAAAESRPRESLEEKPVRLKLSVINPALLKQVFLIKYSR